MRCCGGNNSYQEHETPFSFTSSAILIFFVSKKGVQIGTFCNEVHERDWANIKTIFLTIFAIACVIPCYTTQYFLLFLFYVIKCNKSCTI